MTDSDRRLGLCALGQKRGSGQQGLPENNVHMFSHLEQKRGVLPVPSKVCELIYVLVEDNEPHTSTD